MTQQDMLDLHQVIPGDAVSAKAALRDKLTDILTPGYQAEFDPDEAEQAGAFGEDALSEEDAADSCLDLVNASMSALGNERESS